MQNLNGSQWNIGCVESPTQKIHVGHVHFFFFGVDFISVGSRFSVEYGLYVEDTNLADVEIWLQPVAGNLDVSPK